MLSSSIVERELDLLTNIIIKLSWFTVESEQETQVASYPFLGGGPISGRIRIRPDIGTLFCSFSSAYRLTGNAIPLSLSSLFPEPDKRVIGMTRSYPLDPSVVRAERRPICCSFLASQIARFLHQYLSLMQLNQLNHSRTFPKALSTPHWPLLVAWSISLISFATLFFESSVCLLSAFSSTLLRTRNLLLGSSMNLGFPFDHQDQAAPPFSLLAINQNNKSSFRKWSRW